MKQNNSLSVVIPTFNGSHLISKCLDALTRQKLRPTEIIVVDNGSEDNTISIIKMKYPRVKVIHLDRNYGFSRACNEGIKHSSGKLIALLNNDASPAHDWLENIFKAFIRYPDISVFTPKVVSSKNEKVIESAGDMVKKDLRVAHRGDGEIDKNQYDSEEEVFLVPAVAAIYKKSFFEDVGLFDEYFVSYFEDVDISFRGQLKGHKYLYVPLSVVKHKGKETSKHLESSRGFLELRNSMLVWIKSLPASVLFRKKILFKLIYFYARLIFHNFKFNKIILVIKVTLNIAKNLSSILKQRQKIQSGKKVSDNYLIFNLLKSF